MASSQHLPSLGNLKADVIGLDWRVTIADARRMLGPNFAVQGNLDPLLLTAPQDVLEERAQELIDQGMLEPGYIFNLGHGLFPEAALEKIQALTAFVQQYSRAKLKQQRERN